MGKMWKWPCGVQMMLLCTAVRDGDRSVVVALMVQRYLSGQLYQCQNIHQLAPEIIVISGVRQLWNEQINRSQGNLQTLPFCFLQSVTPRGSGLSCCAANGQQH